MAVHFVFLLVTQIGVALMLVTGLRSHSLFLKCIFIEYCVLDIVVGTWGETEILSVRFLT